jgi:hypothetical protein
VILALLLPALWLVASANRLIDPVSGCGSNRLGASVSTCGHGKQDASNSVCSFEKSARRWSRRLNEQSGPDGFPAPVTISRFQLSQLKHVETLRVDSQTSFGLAKCWQFRWRTALEPRAPSSVS